MKRPAPKPRSRKADQELPFWQRPIRFGSAKSDTPDLKLGAQARATLVRQLATLMAVMPVSDAVATLARQPSTGPEKVVLQRTNRALQAGSSLASALPPSVFPPEVRSTIAAGEASGRLPVLLGRLADTMEAQVALKSRLVSTLAYPVLLILVAIGVIVAMLVFVVPSIAEQLLNSGQPLPFLTRAVLALSSFVQKWWSLLLMLPISGLGGLWVWLGQGKNRLKFDKWLINLPVLGRWLAILESVRWSRLMATMLSSGLPLAEALHITAPTLTNSAWREGVLKMTQQVRAGTSLTAAMALLPNAPGLLLSLVQSGESSGRLSPLLESAANSLDQQVSDRSRTLLALAEPAIIVVLGGLVGLIILAVLLPILQLNTLAGSAIGGS